MLGIVVNILFVLIMYHICYSFLGGLNGKNKQPSKLFSLSLFLHVYIFTKTCYSNFDKSSGIDIILVKLLMEIGPMVERQQPDKSKTL